MKHKPTGVVSKKESGALKTALNSSSCILIAACKHPSMGITNNIIIKAILENGWE